MFLSLASLGWLGGFVVLIYKLTALSVTVIFFINGVFYILLKLWAGQVKIAPAEFDNPQFKVLDEMPKAKLGVLLYIILATTGFYLLFISKSSLILESPWQTIDKRYIIIFFLATLTLGLLIFSKLKAKIILFLLIIHSFLLHSYLPLSHNLIYGADQWRHLAVETNLLQEKPLNIISFDKNPASIIQAFNPGKLAYSQTWATETILSRLTNISLLLINKWLLPIIWSIVFPLLLFELGRILFNDKKQALLFSWLGFLPFAWQAGGSFTLPSNYGFLIWLLFLILILKRVRQPRWEQIIVLATGLLLSIFGYTLYFLLFVLMWVIMEFGKQTVATKRIQILSRAAMTVAAVFFIPVIELFSRYSHFSKTNFLSQLKQFFGNITAYYLATGPRPHDISGGNIVFNQVPNYAFVANFFTQWRWWLVIFMIIFLFIAIVGSIQFISSQNLIKKHTALIAYGLWLGYFISFYLFTGDKILSRRLDSVLALFLILMFFGGLQYFLIKIKKPLKLLVPLLLILSITITASYSFGPDAKTVSVNEYKAMEYVWLQVKTEKQSCVVADTYPLLALEYFSAKNIIGGGFSINQNFAQPEREKLFQELNDNSNEQAWKKALSLTNATKCWLVTSNQSLKINDYFLKSSARATLFGDIIVWSYF